MFFRIPENGKRLKKPAIPKNQFVGFAHSPRVWLLHISEGLTSME
jgi:hypothetical protein